MDQLTIRGFDAALVERLRAEAARDGVSLSRAAIRLMRRGAGLDERAQPAQTVGRSLDHLMGTWDAEQAQAFDEAAGELAHVDADLWR
jgi:plasmid stability protein